MSEQLLLMNFGSIVLTVVPVASVLLGNSEGDGEFILKFTYMC